MRNTLFTLTVFWGLIAGLARPALAQTARIAHFSHSGSMATLNVLADNFGEVAPYFVVDSIKFLSDTTTLEYGSWQGHRNVPTDKTSIHQFNSRLWGDNRVSAKSYIEDVRSARPQLKVVGYDTLLPTQKPTPVLKKQKTKRKKSAFIPVTPVPPQHPGVMLAVAAILVLTGAGWLLGERRGGAPMAVR
ncbi:hypothetical protein [Hymenobacter negativus]|uniref:Uncharacterized protein n=1 Tax=Hymenobacter negativus TaxID=2795026 RepID=A0ABS3QAG9_9BACT|nr:hypothetical protein [Hymenobacter negativus]MBO2008247.1 hypothetical protein [Hymenobacter negativus]